MRVPFHLEHLLIFRRINKFALCYSCGNMTFGFQYSCKQCDLNLHSVCANSLRGRRPLKCESHKHDLYYFGTKLQQFFKRIGEHLFHCSKCHRSCGVENNTEAIDAFSSSELDFEENSAQPIKFLRIQKMAQEIFVKVENNTAAIDAFSSSMSDFEESSDQLCSNLHMNLSKNFESP
ncbi:DC1 - like 10 [Theobroma cacao]|nr:DC1 - like 10 [Theobroma cacao]